MTAIPIDLLVTVPAHDEEDLVAACLESVAAAAGRAMASGHVLSPLIALAAHRCSDETADRAREVMADCPVPFRLMPDSTSTTVGEVRARLVERASVRHLLADTGWLFTTDADSVVPIDWITATLDRLRSSGAVAAAGMVEVTGWTASPAARRRYLRIVDGGLGEHGHSHVYGANLAVRRDAYRAVGGFRPVTHGEDQDLVDRLRSNGFPVISTLTPMVRTSGRMPGRAAHGLGRLLADLADDGDDAERAGGGTTSPGSRSARG